MESTLIWSPLRVPLTVAVTSVPGSFGSFARFAPSLLFFMASAAFALPAASNRRTLPEVSKANDVVDAVGAQAAPFCCAAQLASISFPV